MNIMNKIKANIIDITTIGISIEFSKLFILKDYEIFNNKWLNNIIIANIGFFIYELIVNNKKYENNTKTMFLKNLMIISIIVLVKEILFQNNKINLKYFFTTILLPSIIITFYQFLKSFDELENKYKKTLGYDIFRKILIVLLSIFLPLKDISIDNHIETMIISTGFTLITRLSAHKFLKI